MNNGYYQNPTFPGTGINTNNGQNQKFPNKQIVPNQQSVPSYENTQTSNNVNFVLPAEQSYIENILRLNRGKMAKFHITVPGSIEWQDRVFNGIIEQAGRDHIIVSNPQTGEWYLILMIYLDFVTFEEPINYNKEFVPNPSLQN